MKLLVFGAGGHGKCVVAALLARGERPDAILDDSPNVESIFGVPVFSAHSFVFPSRFEFVVGIGDCDARRSKFEMLCANGGTPRSVIHPKAFISSPAEIGRGSVALAFAYVDPGVSIGENAILNVACGIGHGTHIGNHVHISANAIVAADCCVGDSAWISMGANVKEGTQIGEGAFIGIGALVTHDVPARHKAISPQRKEAMILAI